MRRPAIALVAVFLGSTAGATDYYVDPVRGDDANPGTAAAPWQTLTHAGRTVSTPGDRIIAAPGLYGPVWAEPVAAVFQLRTGISFMGAGSGRTILENLPMEVPLRHDTVVLDVELSGFTTRRGPFVRGGIELETRVVAATVLVRDVRFVDTRLYLKPWEACPSVVFLVVEQSEFSRSTLIGPSLEIGSWDFPGFSCYDLSVAVRNCLFREVDRGVYARRWITSCIGGVEMDLSLVNNTFVNARDSAVVLESGCEDLTASRITNNIFVGSSRYAVEEIEVSDAPLVAELANNLFLDNVLGLYADIETGVAGTASDLNALGQASGNIEATPIFVAPAVGDFRLAPGSPGIDAGLDAAAPPTTPRGTRDRSTATATGWP